MNNTWIVVPVISNDVNLDSFVDKITGGYVAPATYEKKFLNRETMQIETENVPHPYAGQTGPDFTNRIIFINKIAGYTEYNGVVHIEDFNDINIYRYWNLGINHAISNGAENILLLNGVIDFDPFAIKDAHNKYMDTGKEVINVSDGAIILLSANSSLRADEQFKIWFGDNDFYRRAENSTEWSRSEFINMSYIFDHVHDETFNNIVASDEVLYNAKWN